jgi:hypothetical protein
MFPLDCEQSRGIPAGDFFADCSKLVGLEQPLYFPTNFSNAESCFVMKSLVG